MNPLAEKYLRKSALPTIFCPGCGDGTVLSALLRVIEATGGPGNYALVGGIGCSGWIPVYVNTDVIHALHGRAIPVATGLALAMPGKNIVVVSGDGDCSGIGGNHLIHAARRNMNLTVVMINNYIYGMTGGQVSPTTPWEGRTKTSPYGNGEQPFDVPALVIAAGATFVAREIAVAPKRMERTLAAAVAHKGFSFVEIMTQCPTQAGRNLFGTGSPGDIYHALKKAAVAKADVEPGPGRFRVGVLRHDQDKQPYTPPQC
jgi:2-oxoglutarate ferredoxin oxidoreductase subunit beta